MTKKTCETCSSRFTIKEEDIHRVLCWSLFFLYAAGWVLWVQGPQLEQGFEYEQSHVWLLNYSAMVQTSIQTLYTSNIKIWMEDAVLLKMWALADILWQFFFKLSTYIEYLIKQQMFQRQTLIVFCLDHMANNCYLLSIMLFEGKIQTNIPCRLPGYFKSVSQVINDQLWGHTNMR